MEKESEKKKWMEYLKELIVDIYYNCGIYCVHLRTFFKKNFIYFWHIEKEKEKKLLEYLKEFIVDIYYNDRIHSGYLLQNIICVIILCITKGTNVTIV